MILGIIGIGVMGSHHLRIASTMSDIKKIVISDSDQAKIGEKKKKYNISAYTDHLELLEKEKPDAVVVAVPTKYHKKIVIDCLEHETHVLVEKPIAETIEDAKEMMNLAKQKNKLFTVGHVERFNPIIKKLKELITENFIGEPYLIKTTRVGPFPKRLYGMPGGVLVDLAVHDLDIIQYLFGPITDLSSQLIVEGSQEIYSKVLFNINSKLKGSCEFSWISPKRIREIEVYGSKGLFKCAYDKQNITFYENADFTEDKNNVFCGGHIASGKTITIPITKDEPLRLELRNFVKSVLNQDKILVTPEQATQALDIALKILDS